MQMYALSSLVCNYNEIVESTTRVKVSRSYIGGLEKGSTLMYEMMWARSAEGENVGELVGTRASPGVECSSST